MEVTRVNMWSVELISRIVHVL